MSNVNSRPHRIISAIALCLVAVLAFSAASGCGDNGDKPPATTSSKPTSPASGTETASDTPHPGKKVFKTATCASCHDTAGKPNPTQAANPSLVGIWTRIWSNTDATWDMLGKRPSVRLSDELYKQRVANLKADDPEHYEKNKALYERVLAVPETDKAGRFLAWLQCRIENGKFDAPDSAMLVPPMKDGDKQVLVEYLQTLVE
jgi:hypothetical protein